MIHAVPYIRNNPVRAGLANCAEDWCWSSAKAHLTRENDALVRWDSLGGITSDWGVFLSNDKREVHEKIRRATKTGRPIGDDLFYKKLEEICERPLQPQKGGRKRLEKNGLP